MKNAKIGFSMAINGEVSTAFESWGKALPNRLDFVDTENNTYQIVIIPPKVIITKTGKIFTKMTFHNQAITTGTIHLADSHIDLRIQTVMLKVSMNAITIIYDLLDEDDIISNHHLHLNWQLDTERKEN
ncbi:MAG: DUF1934 family protein [Candidatus Izemoplasmatales bacterium]|jgi:uncharacterized beta-barrel protein YwiB (DUF1934 family)